ncbi:MAG: hypothetical protein ABSF95_17750 [Verrucomicrobiota bacterium]
MRKIAPLSLNNAGGAQSRAAPQPPLRFLRCLLLAVCWSGAHHSGRLRHESADAKAGRLIAQELQRLNRKEPDLKEHPKSRPLKLAMAARLRRKTALAIRQIAQRLHMGSWKSLNRKPYLRNNTGPKGPGK